jgi:hypothetical protein
MTRFQDLAIWVAILTIAFCLKTQNGYAQAPQIYLDVEEEIARPGNLVPVSIFIVNLGDSIRAFQIGLTLDRPDIMAFNTYTSIQTCYECGNQACTSVVAFPCTVDVVPVTASGTLAQNWEFVQAITFGSFDIRLTGIADTDLDSLPGPIVPFMNGILIKVIAEVFCDIPDTLTDRTVVATISPVNTYFSNASGNPIEPLDLTSGAVTISFTQNGDMDGDGFHTALDLGFMIDLLFAGGAYPCPEYVADMNCDTFPDVLDLGWLINLLFANGIPSPCSN